MGEPIAAIATPPGRGAIGIIRLGGDGCLGLAARFLRLKRALKPRVATVVWIQDASCLLDQALVTYFPAADSYMGEDVLEISAHGSPYILERLLNLCLEAGARLAAPGEFTQRAFLNGRMDLAQAEAVCDLIQAKTRLAHRAAINQLEGGLSRSIAELRIRLLDLRAGIEAALDHPDEDLPLVCGKDIRGRVGGLAGDVRALAESFHRGRLARGGARIAIIGRPNAGKSSLLNALLGSARAIVDDSPGTTRDTVEESADLSGLDAVLIDTAGLRENAANPVELQGIARTRTALEGCDLALCVIDRTAPLNHSEPILQDLLRGHAKPFRPTVVVLNKSDADSPLCGAAELLRKVPEYSSFVEVSALRRTGLEALVHKIREELKSQFSEDDAGSTLVTSLRHHQALRACAAELEAAEDEAQLELAAARLRASQEALDAVVGGSGTEELLSEIFSRFCIGK